MSKKADNNVIDLFSRAKKTGKKEKTTSSGYEKIAPEDDVVVMLATSLIGVVDKYVDAHPVQLMAAFKLAITAVHEDYVRRYGNDDVMKLMKISSQIGARYKAVFIEERSRDHGTSDEPTETT